ncbi:TPA: hypothetical protein N3459_002249 [Klebsiella pneumoniae]|nr:hypothetical protein [Klebsiella pneumoniae]HCM8023805.1 hypothetical protein [Klebsiella pneumoniae]
MNNNEEINELKQNVKDLVTRCQAADFAISLIAAALPPGSKGIIAENFERLMQDQISRLTDDEARMNSAVTAQLRLLLSAVLK